MGAAEPLIRPLDPGAEAEIELVAQRMQETLLEVLGPQRGGEMYSIEWLVERVRAHLDPAQIIGQVFLAETPASQILGHTIVRIDDDGQGKAIGLFSTTYVLPEARKRGVATALLQRGEAWMLEQGLTEAITYTDKENTRLQQLYIEHGYTLSPMPEQFVKLAKALTPASP